ncbi:MAG TPA: Gfo/Idh/MocA family oxidoreductase [Acidobacteriaceae bacterium]|nr:Gfo/Idh/MocA family oxidoreductase [Acidobacteriaceae bacterium]
MAAKPIRTAVVGSGFMGRVHLEMLRRVEHVEIAAIAARNTAAAEALGSAFGVPHTSFDAVLRDSSIDAVDICTPNAMHFAMTRDALCAGKHVLCEKPVATTVGQAEELVALAAKLNLRNGVCHNLRFYPMVQQMRRMREDGDLGEILVVQGTYSQDWLLYETDWNWRVTTRDGGLSRAMADIGSHWFDTAEHVTGLRVHTLCADLATVHKTRRQPKQAVETFANKMLAADDYVDTPVDTEDVGAVIFRIGPRARGSMTASQVSAGRKNRLSIEIYGTRAGVAWDQERPDELWIGHRDSPNCVIVKDPSLMKPAARAYADLPGGHSEGYDDTFKQIFRRFYRSIADPAAPQEYPQFADGLRQLVILRAELESSRTRAWIEVPQP